MSEKWTKESREAVVISAIRWSRNILTDVLGNHGHHISREMRDAIRGAIEALAGVI